MPLAVLKMPLVMPEMMFLANVGDVTGGVGDVTGIEGDVIDDAGYRFLCYLQCRRCYYDVAGEAYCYL